MRIKKITLKTSVVILSAAALAACSTPKMYYKASGNVDTTQATIKKDVQQQLDQAKTNSSVIVKDSMYVSDQRIDLRRQPAWLQRSITLHGDELPFSFYSRSIVRNSSVLTTYQQGLDPSLMVNLNYSGNIKGALDLLAAKTGYVYEINGNHIYWKAFITKTFNIAFMPGSSNYLVGKDKSGSSGGAATSGGGGGGGSSGGGSGGGATTVDATTSGASQDEYSNMQGKLSVWDDLKDTIASMLSPQGTVIVSESTTTITVKDHPNNINQVSGYIKKINAFLSQEVMLKVQVLQVNLSSSFENGINWNLVTNFVQGTKFAFNGNFSQPISLSPIAGGSAPSAIGFKNANGASSVLFNALSQQGKVSIATEPTVVTTNAQVASINITSTVGYLAQVENTTTNDQTTGNQTSTQLTPGEVTTGLTLYVLPKIMDNKIYLQISSDISTLVQIRNLFATGVDANPSASSQKIQVPDIDSKEFNQRGVVTSGSTLILAGFKQLTNQTSAEQMLQSDALGGRGALQQQVETIVLITPYILDNDTNNNNSNGQ